MFSSRSFSTVTLPSLFPRTGRNEVFLGLVFLIGLLTVSYFTLYSRPLFGLATLAAIGLFILSFLNMGAGLGLFIAAILFSPEIPLAGGLMGTFRSVNVRAEDFLAIIFLLGWLARLAIMREHRLLKETRLNRPILIFMLLSVFSTTRGVACGLIIPATGFLFLLKYIQYFLIFFLVVRYVQTYAQVKKFLILTLVVILLFSAYAIWQIPQIEIWSNRRIAAPFSHQQESTSIGGIFVFAMAVLMSLLIYVKGAKSKFWMCLALLAMFVPFLYTLSRTSYFAFAFMILMVVAYSMNRVLIISVFLLALLSPIVIPQEVIDRVAYTWRDARELGVDPSTQERILIYQKVLVNTQAIMLNNINGFMDAMIGFGIGAYDIMDAQYMRTIVESGLVGLALFLYILFLIYQMAYSIYSKTRLAWMKGFSLGYIAGLLGLIVHGLGAITFTMIRTMEAFWFLTGIIFVYASIMDRVEPEILAKHPELALAEKT